MGRNLLFLHIVTGIFIAHTLEARVGEDNSALTATKKNKKKIKKRKKERNSAFFPPNYGFILHARNRLAGPISIAPTPLPEASSPTPKGIMQTINHNSQL